MSSYSRNKKLFNSISDGKWELPGTYKMKYENDQT